MTHHSPMLTAIRNGVANGKPTLSAAEGHPEAQERARTGTAPFGKQHSDDTIGEEKHAATHSPTCTRSLQGHSHSFTW